MIRSATVWTRIEDARTGQDADERYFASVASCRPDALPTGPAAAADNPTVNTTAEISRHPVRESRIIRHIDAFATCSQRRPRTALVMCSEALAAPGPGMFPLTHERLEPFALAQPFRVTLATAGQTILASGCIARMFVSLRFAAVGGRCRYPATSQTNG